MSPGAHWQVVVDALVLLEGLSDPVNGPSWMINDGLCGGLGIFSRETELMPALCLDLSWVFTLSIFWKSQDFWRISEGLTFEALQMIYLFLNKTNRLENQPKLPVDKLLH